MFDRDASPDTAGVMTVGMASGARVVAARQPDDVGLGRAPVGAARRLEIPASFGVGDLDVEPARVASGSGLVGRGALSVPPGVRAAVASGERPRGVGASVVSTGGGATFA